MLFIRIENKFNILKMALEIEHRWNDYAVNLAEYSHKQFLEHCECLAYNILMKDKYIILQV